MVNLGYYSIDTTKFSKKVKELVKKERGLELPYKTIEDILNGTIIPDLKTIYTVGEIGRLPTEELGLTYDFRIDGRRLKEWRKREGLSQKKLAKMCDVDQKTISFLENEKYKRIYIETAKKIVQGTGLTKSYLGLPETPFSKEELSKEDWNKIIGCLFGDGSIVFQKFCRSYFVLGGRDMRYVGFIQQELGNSGILGNIAVIDRGNWKLSRFQSQASPLFDELHKKFYMYDPEHPSSHEKGFRKHISEEILELMDRTALKLWYMGHGRLSKVRLIHVVRISTLIYPKKEIELVEDKLRSFGFKLNKSYKLGKYEGEDRGYIISLSAKSTRDFFDFIGECPDIAKDAVTRERYGARMRDKWP